MFEWFRKRKRKAADAPSHGRALHEAAGASADAIATLGPLVDDMRAKGYQGPFGGSIDGINVLIFHAPGVNPVPTWLNRDGYF
jgi:hypothetical protein